MMALRRLVEHYLAEAGPKTACVLMSTFVAWAIIAIAALLYAALSGFRIVWSATRAPFDGGAVDIALAAVFWIFVGMTVVLAAAGRDLLLRWRSQRWNAEIALANLEKRLFSAHQSTAHIERVRDRLAARALESMEHRILGEPVSKDVGIEERLIELDNAARSDNPEDR